MKTINWVKEHIFSFLCFILVCVLLLYTCTRPKYPQGTTITTTHDTAYVTHDTTIYQAGNTLQIIKRIHDTTEYNSVEYVPSENYDSLVEQFSALKEALLTKNVYSNEYKKDSSSVVITDTLQKNIFVGRRVDWHLKYPVITNTTTITIPQKKRNVVYIGGGINGNQIKPLNDVEVDVLLKNKTDKMYGIGVSSTITGQISYGIKAYFPIHLRKQ